MMEKSEQEEVTHDSEVLRAYLPEGWGEVPREILDLCMHVVVERFLEVAERNLEAVGLEGVFFQGDGIGRYIGLIGRPEGGEKYFAYLAVRRPILYLGRDPLRTFAVKVVFSGEGRELLREAFLFFVSREKCASLFRRVTKLIAQAPPDLQEKFARIPFPPRCREERVA